MILYGKVSCPWALRARFALAEAGIPFELVTPDDPRWDPRLTITPVLVTPDGWLPESADIVRWARASRGLVEAVPPPGSAAERLRDTVVATKTPADVPRLLAAVVAALPETGWIDGEEPGPRDLEAWMALAAASNYGARLPPAATAYWSRARERATVRQVLGSFQKVGTASPEPA